MAATQRSVGLCWRRCACAAVDAVISDDDLVTLILCQGIGPASFVAACMVCKSWLRVCRSDERVLRGVALYTGALTKGEFMKLFAVTSGEADVLPRSSHRRYGGGSYFLYRDDAVDAVLAAGGVKAWQRRLQMRAERPCIVKWPKQADCFRLASRREERLHGQEVQRRALLLAQRG